LKGRTERVRLGVGERDRLCPQSMCVLLCVLGFANNLTDGSKRGFGATTPSGMSPAAPEAGDLGVRGETDRACSGDGSEHPRVVVPVYHK
jgi:hypothetical protein